MSEGKTTAEWLKGLVATRRQNYIKSFEGVYGEGVLKDLAKFCRAHDTTFNPDQRLSDVLIGRREVWLRISEHLNLTEDELYTKYR